MIKYKIRDFDWLTFPLIIVNFNHFFIQPAPGSLPTHGAAEKTLVGAGHVILSKIRYFMGWGKYKITCFHIQVIYFKCKERDLIVTNDNINFLI